MPPFTQSISLKHKLFFATISLNMLVVIHGEERECSFKLQLKLPFSSLVFSREVCRARKAWHLSVSHSESFLASSSSHHPPPQFQKIKWCEEPDHDGPRLDSPRGILIEIVSLHKLYSVWVARTPGGWLSWTFKGLAWNPVFEHRHSMYKEAGLGCTHAFHD